MKKQTIGKIIGWIAFLCALTAFFWQANIMAVIAIALSIIGFILRANTTKMNATATGMALVAILLGMITY